MKKVLVGVVTGIALTTAAAAFGNGPWPGTYSWFQGDSEAGIGRIGNALSMFSNADLNAHAHHLRVESEDGNVELESGTNVPATTLNPYYIGTATRKPLAVGWPDGQDVLPLYVVGSAAQKHDLQQWRSGAKTLAAIDGRGRLRLGDITLGIQMVDGRAVLYALLPGGRRQALTR